MPLFFATGVHPSGVTTGVLAKSREGRPIKLEGNPTTRRASAAIDAVAQASLLNLYDPDRSRQVTAEGRRRQPGTTAVGELRRRAVDTAGADGQGGPHPDRNDHLADHGRPDRQPSSCGPTRGAKWVQYEPAGRDNVREGARLGVRRVRQRRSTTSPRPTWSLVAGRRLPGCRPGQSGTPATSTSCARPTEGRRARSAAERAEPALRGRVDADRDRRGRRPPAADAVGGRRGVRPALAAASSASTGRSAAAAPAEPAGVGRAARQGPASAPRAEAS